MEINPNILLGRQSRAQITVAEVRHRKSRDREKQEERGERISRR